MSINIVLVLVYHRHKLLDRICVLYVTAVGKHFHKLNERISSITIITIKTQLYIYHYI
jgi:hypothetical protein